jgi:hypothetical protein
MKLRRVNRQAGGPVSIYPFLLIMGMLVVAGCGGGAEGIDGYSQEFPVPKGAAKAEPAGPSLTRSQRRRKEIEESRTEPVVKSKGKRGRQ